MGIFEEFWKRKAGKAQVFSTIGWMIALVYALHIRSFEVLQVLPIAGFGIMAFFCCYGFREWKRKLQHKEG